VPAPAARGSGYQPTGLGQPGARIREHERWQRWTRKRQHLSPLCCRITPA